MGKIKKILENELVGGTQTTDVYPVTSVKAIYDEDNERLDNIINRRGVVNISTNYNSDHIAEVLTLEQAIAKVPSKDRVLGFQGNVLTPSGWITYKFIGTDITQWSNAEYWSTIIDSSILEQEIGDGENVVMSQKAVCDAVGLNEYPMFSESTTYSAGDVVNYNGKLYKFTTTHTAGAWTGTDVEETGAVKAHIVQELGNNENAVVSQKTITKEIDKLKVGNTLFIDYSKRIFDELYISGSESYNGLKVRVSKRSSGGINIQIYENVSETVIFSSSIATEDVNGIKKANVNTKTTAFCLFLLYEGCLDNLSDDTIEVDILSTSYNSDYSPSIKHILSQLSDSAFIFTGKMINSNKYASSASYVSTKIHKIPDSRLLYLIGQINGNRIALIKDTGEYENVPSQLVTDLSDTSYVAVMVSCLTGYAMLSNLNGDGFYNNTTDLSIKAILSDTEPSAKVLFPNTIFNNGTMSVSNVIDMEFYPCKNIKRVSFRNVVTSSTPAIIFLGSNYEVIKTSEVGGEEGAIIELDIPDSTNYIVYHYWNESRITSNELSERYISFSSVSEEEDKEDIIVSDVLDLQGETVYYENKTIHFGENGKIINGTINGTYIIDAKDHQCIFDLTTNLRGNLLNPYISVKWFGARGNSFYDKDANYSTLYNKGTDDTPYINWSLMQCRYLNNKRVYIPKGVYWVRNQEEFSEQWDKDTNRRGLRCAIWLYDNTELFGDGDDTKIVRVDYMTESDYSSSSPKFRTQDVIGLALMDDEEMQNNTLLSEYTYNGSLCTNLKNVYDAFLSNGIRDEYIRLVGRHDVTVHDIYIDARTSLYPNPDEINTAWAIIFVCMSYNRTPAVKPMILGSYNNEIYNCTFYNAAMGTLYRGRSGYDKSLVYDCSVHDNRFIKGTNKAIEQSPATHINVYRNLISEYEVGIQPLGGEYVFISNNTIRDCDGGINVTNTSNNIFISQNDVYDCKDCMLLRCDTDAVEYNEIRNVYISNNSFIQGSEADENNVVFAIRGNPQQVDTTSSYFKINGVFIKNNVFKGNKAIIGVSDEQNYGGHGSWEIDGITTGGNTWECNVSIENTVTKSGLKPESSMRNVTFNDNIHSVCEIKGNVTNTIFRGNIIYGTLTINSSKYILDDVLIDGGEIKELGGTKIKKSVYDINS